MEKPDPVPVEGENYSSLTVATDSDLFTFISGLEDNNETYDPDGGGSFHILGFDQSEGNTNFYFRAI